MHFFAPNLLSRFRPSEWALVAYCLAMTLVCVVFAGRIPAWYAYAAGHLAIALLTAVMVGAESRPARLLRDFDMPLYLTAIFFMVCQLVHRVHPTDYDAQLIAIDRSIGGIALLRAMGAIETPFLTAFSKAAWISYYFIAFIPAVALYRRADRSAFHETKLIFMLGWLLSYVGYFIVPAEGPGYHQQEVGVAQPVWSGGTSVAKDVIYALEGDARDTFPSGHVIVAALVIFTCVRHRMWTAAAFGIPLALGVIWSTLYLRYHYLIDAIAGLAVAALCAGVGIGWSRLRREKA